MTGRITNKRKNDEPYHVNVKAIPSDIYSHLVQVNYLSGTKLRRLKN